MSPFIFRTRVLIIQIFYFDFVEFSNVSDIISILTIVAKAACDLTIVAKATCEEMQNREKDILPGKIITPFVIHFY